MDNRSSNYTFGKHADNVFASNKKPNKRLQYSFGVHFSAAKIGSIIKYEIHAHYCGCWNGCKIFHVVWNNLVEFKRVLIHLGDFHGMLELFSIIGKVVQGSGFEDIVYQTGLCTSGDINGIIAGKHCNRCWFVNESFAEALDRLFCECCGISCLSDLISLIKGIENEDDCEELVSQEAFQRYEKEYERRRNECLQGKFGKTVQFWMIYIHLIERQHKLYLSVNLNNFELRLHCWRKLQHFAFQQINKTMHDMERTTVCS